jgi:hypothetical protein
MSIPFRSHGAFSMYFSTPISMKLWWMCIRRLRALGLPRRPRGLAQAPSTLTCSLTHIQGVCAFTFSAFLVDCLSGPSFKCRACALSMLKLIPGPASRKLAKRVYCEVYGCSANQADGEIALGLLRSRGLRGRRQPSRSRLRCPGHLRSQETHGRPHGPQD